MEDVKYSREDALKIAEKLLTDGHLNEVKDKGPFGVEVTVETARGLMTDDAILRDKIKPKIFGRMTEKDLFTTEQLTEALAAEGVKIPDAKEKITAAARQLNLGTSAPAEKPIKTPAQLQAKVDPEVKGATAPTNLVEDGSKPDAMEAIKSFLKLDDYGKEIKRRKELPDYQGGILNGAQNFIILLITMFANVISGGKAYVEEPKTTREQKKTYPTPAQEKEKQLTQQVQLAQAEEAQLEAQKPKKLPEPPRELIINHFGEGGIRRNTEDMQKFQEALAQSHVPDGTNVSPSSSVGKSNLGPDMSFGRSLA